MTRLLLTILTVWGALLLLIVAVVARLGEADDLLDNLHEAGHMPVPEPDPDWLADLYNHLAMEQDQ